MAYEFMGKGGLGYFPCRYGASKLIFRGPKRSLRAGYCAVIGGSETFGKFIEQPYPELLENWTGRRIVNLGCMYAGAGLFSHEPEILKICTKADITIVQLAGAQNMCNRFYNVHPRRNDRFLGATEPLRSLFPEIDFFDVHFTGHLIEILQQASCERFEMVREELQIQWVARMQAMLSKIGGTVILLWLADHSPDAVDPDRWRSPDPMFLCREMIDQIVGQTAGLVEIVATPDEISAGHERMIFSQLEQAAAHQMLGPIAHQQAARRLQPYLDRA